MPSPEGSSIRGDMWMVGSLLCGYAVDDRNLDMRLAVEILADGEPVALLRAEEGREVNGAEIGGDGCYCFSFRVPDYLLAQARRFVARVANRDDVLGAVDVTLNHGSREGSPLSPGVVTWSGGLRLSGHVPRERNGDPVPVVRALIAGVEVAQATCRNWVQIDAGLVARGFNLELPALYADGRARVVEVISSAGSPLAGSPSTVAAFPDPLADWIDGWAELESERLRARFADGLLPRTLPISDIEGWLRRFCPPAVDKTEINRIAVVLVGDDHNNATLASLDRQVGVVWRAAFLPSLDTPVSFDPQRLFDVLAGEASDCSLIVMAVAGTQFASGALARLSEALERYPQASAVYPDILVQAHDGRRWPLAFPAYDPELFLERGYCGLVYALRRADLLRSPHRDASLFGFFPASATAPRESWPVHVPFPLATVPNLSPSDIVSALQSATRRTLAADGEAAAEVHVTSTPGAASVRVCRPTRRAAVSVIVAARDNPAALERTLLSVEGDCAEDGNEIIVVDNESSDLRTLHLLDRAEASGHRVLRVPGWFRPAYLLSLGADASRGDHFLFLEAGIAGAGVGWLTEMRGRLAGHDVGAVGALVSWMSGVVRDAGFVVGPRFKLAPRFTNSMADDLGYGGLLGTSHGCSALSAACLLTPRSLFLSLGGFDTTNFPRHLFSADYCLRAEAVSRRVVFTPHAKMTMRGHSEADDPLRAPGATRERENRLFFERWTAVPGCDPYYSPWMAMDDVPYSGLAWPPAPFQPRASERLVPSSFPFGL